MCTAHSAAKTDIKMVNIELLNIELLPRYMSTVHSTIYREWYLRWSCLWDYFFSGLSWLSVLCSGFVQCIAHSAADTETCDDQVFLTLTVFVVCQWTAKEQRTSKVAIKSKWHVLFVIYFYSGCVYSLWKYIDLTACRAACGVSEIEGWSNWDGTLTRVWILSYNTSLR